MPTSYFVGILRFDLAFGLALAPYAGFAPVLLRGYREFEQRIDSLADRREPKGMAVLRSEKHQLLPEACLHQLAPLLVSAIEQESLGISRELIRQVL